MQILLDRPLRKSITLLHFFIDASLYIKWGGFKTQKITVWMSRTTGWTDEIIQVATWTTH